MKLHPGLKQQYAEVEQQVATQLAKQYEEEIDLIRRDLVKMIDNKFTQLLENIDNYLQLEIPKQVREQLERDENE